MNIELWTIGKLSDPYIKDGCDIYMKRLKHYCKFNINVLKAKKIMNGQTVSNFKTQEAKELLEKISPNDYIVLLDETGKSMNSPNFGKFIEKQMISGKKKIIFIIAGAYGADQILQKRANAMISFSAMTFTHQMIRLFFVEQLYRAFTIIKNEAYHK